MTTNLTQAPAAIAREAFKQLALRKVAPTPENYARLYAETARVKLTEVQPALGAIEALARELRADAGRAQLAQQLHEALGKSDWEGVKGALRALASRTAPAEAARAATPGERFAAQLRRDGAEQELIQSLRELAAKALTAFIELRVGFSEKILDQLRAVDALVAVADSPAKVREAHTKLKSTLLTIELRGEGPEALVRSLHGLLQLLLANVADLGADDQWIERHVAQVQATLDQPLTRASLERVELSFKDFAYRQSAIRASIDQTKAAIREMMAMFIERLGAVTVSTGEFSGRIARYSERIRSTENLQELPGLLESLLKDTTIIQADMARTHGELDEARRKVALYEARVAALESQLMEANELVREDALTRALNRRGLEQQFAVELARARRKAVPLAIGLIDLDDFKKLNDRYGHQAGDAALRRVVEVGRTALRPTDSLARFGGEEFVVLFPESDVEAAHVALSRVLKRLAERPLVWDGEEITLTFSAGIAALRDEEMLDRLVERADAAMYTAKRAGKNRIERSTG